MVGGCGIRLAHSPRLDRAAQAIYKREQPCVCNRSTGPTMMAEGKAVVTTAFAPCYGREPGSNSDRNRERGLFGAIHGLPGIRDWPGDGEPSTDGLGPQMAPNRASTSKRRLPLPVEA